MNQIYDKKIHPKIIKKCLSQQMTITRMCREFLKVDRVTYYYWLNDPKKPEVKKAIEDAEKMIADDMNKALFKLMKGGVYTETEEIYDAKGKLIQRKKKKRKKEPDLAAIKFYKLNRDSANWSERREIGVSGEIEHRHSVPAAAQEILDKLGVKDSNEHHD